MAVSAQLDSSVARAVGGARTDETERAHSLSMSRGSRAASAVGVGVAGAAPIPKPSIARRSQAAKPARATREIKALKVRIFDDVKYL